MSFFLRPGTGLLKYLSLTVTCQESHRRIVVTAVVSKFIRKAPASDRLVPQGGIEPMNNVANSKRVFYVAATRARDRASALVSSNNRSASSKKRSRSSS
jgi:hypothetical protein